MLKKVTVCLLTILAFSFFLSAQVSYGDGNILAGMTGIPQEEIPVVLETQHIKWKRVSRAWKYDIEVQRLYDYDNWTDVGTYRTNRTEYDLELEPGTYRLRISPLNILSKRGTPSDWAEFDIIESSQPYIIKESFPVNRLYGVRAITRTTADDMGKETISVRGANCFDEDTRFNLIPVKDTSSLTPAFTALDQCVQVNLPVIRRDPENLTVELSLDWSRINPGYYNLAVENGKGKSDSVVLLVLPVRSVKFDDSSFEVDAATGGVCLNMAAGEKLSLKASSVQCDTVFSLIPSDSDGSGYPFISGMARQNVQLPVASYNSNKLVLNAETSLVRTGWYDLKAETPGCETVAKRVLVKMSYPELSSTQLSGVSGKFNEGSQTLALTFSSDQAVFSDLEENAEKIFLISETNQYGENKRTQFRKTSVDKKHKSAVFEASASSVQPGLYAVMFETEEGSDLYFVDVQSNYKTKLVELSDDEITEKFLLPASEEALALHEATLAEAEAAGLKLPEYLPAFRNVTYNTWSRDILSSFPSSVSSEDDTLLLSVHNNVPGKRYAINYYVEDPETLDMLRTSEGMSFQSMVTKRNNSWTHWSLTIETEDGSTNIPLTSRKRSLAQTVVVWGDYGIQPKDITRVYYTVKANNPQETGWYNLLEISEAKTWSSLDPVRAFTMKAPKFLSKIGFSVGQLLGTDVQTRRESPEYAALVDDRLDNRSILSSARLTLFDADWFAFNAVCYPPGIGSKHMYGDEIVLSIPNDWFRPYIGYGNAYSGETQWNELFAGLVLFKYIDVRYSFLHKEALFPANNVAGVNPKGDLLFWNNQWIQIGLNIPLRKKTPEKVPLKSEENKLTFPFFSDILLGLEMTGHNYFPFSTYSSYLNDISLGIRLLDLKYFALDAVTVLRDIPAENVLDLGVIDVRGEALFRLPFKLFKQNCELYYGLGGGLWFENLDNLKNGRISDFLKQEKQICVSESVGIKFGKYVNLKASFIMNEDDFLDNLKLAGASSVMAPVVFGISSDLLTFSASITIPLHN